MAQLKFGGIRGMEVVCLGHEPRTRGPKASEVCSNICIGYGGMIYTKPPRTFFTGVPSSFLKS